jgi:nucleoporin-like protein 2
LVLFLQIEGERNLQNAKVMEFTNFLNNPRVSVSQTTSFPTVAYFPEVKNNSPFGVPQTNGPPVFSSFSQVGSANNFGPGPRTAPGVPTNSLFGQSSQASHPAFPAPTFGRSDMKFGVSGSQQPSGSLQGSSMSSAGNFPKPPAGYQQSASSSHHRDIDRQSLDLLSGIIAPTSAVNQAPVEENKNENQDDSIWLKEKWSIGEIPLGEPPQRHISHVF